MATHNYNGTITVVENGLPLGQAQIAAAGGNPVDSLTTILTGTGPITIPAHVIVANVQLVLIVSDQDLTLKTNSNASPLQTFALKANKPIFWIATSGQTNPLTTDFTDFFATAGVIPASANLTIVVLQS